MLLQWHNFLRVTGLIAVAAATSATARPPQAHELDASYTFDDYLAHFDKSYSDPKEYDRRSKIFAKNMDTILSHNEGRMTETGAVIRGYVMGVNPFTDVDSDELPLGYNKAHHPAWKSQLMASSALMTERKLGAGSTTTSYSKTPSFTLDEVSDLPASKDWTEEGIVNPVVPSQGGCGSCWSFAAIGAIEAQLAKATGQEPVSLSEQTLLDCSPDPMQCGGVGKCNGSTPELAFNYVADATAKKTSGVFAIDDVPYKPETTTCEDHLDGITPVAGIDGWVALPSNSYKYVMNALAKVGPLAIAIAAGGGVMGYEKGVMSEGDGIGETTVNHAVLLVGYGTDAETGEDFYKVRNSWGSLYGESGYIRFKRTPDDANLCGMDTDPLVGTACALDEDGNKLTPEPVKVCGNNAILFDASYPTGVNSWSTFA